MKDVLKNRKRSLIWLSVLIVSLLLSACGAPNVDWDLSISGEVSNPTTFSYKELAGMKLVDLSDVYMEKSHGEDEVRSFSGVDLASLLEAAGAPEDFSSITAYAADGYAIEISKDELVDGIVAMKDGGDWIAKGDTDEGPIRLVFPSTPANRWIYQVTEIVVNP
jgi:DMSO/TMAO reductase YedYZ molybdopterin-dependent catalytic subunit